MNKVTEKLLQIFTSYYPELKPSVLFFSNGIMYISKYINGEMITKEAERKYDKRYDWKYE